MSFVPLLDENPQTVKISWVHQHCKLNYTVSFKNKKNIWSCLFNGKAPNQ